jgi:hypothetical protein
VTRVSIYNSKGTYEVMTITLFTITNIGFLSIASVYFSTMHNKNHFLSNMLFGHRKGV